MFPPIEPYNTGMLKVSDIHSVYYEQSGNKTGKPAIFLYVTLIIIVKEVNTKYHKNSIKRPHSNNCPYPYLGAKNGHFIYEFWNSRNL